MTARLVQVILSDDRLAGKGDDERDPVRRVWTMYLPDGSPLMAIDAWNANVAELHQPNLIRALRGPDNDREA